MAPASAQYERLPQLNPADSSLDLPSPPSEGPRPPTHQIGAAAEDLSAFTKFNIRLDRYLDEKRGDGGGEVGSSGESEVDEDEKRGMGKDPERGMEATPRWPNNDGPASSFLPKRAAFRKALYASGVLLLLVFLVLAGGGSAGIRKTSRYQGTGLREVSFDHTMNGTFTVRRKVFQWLREAGDGVHVEVNTTGVFLVDVESNATTTLFEDAQLRDPNGKRLLWWEFTVSSDLRYVIVNTDRQKVWRWSSRSNFWIWDTLDQQVTPLANHSFPPQTAFTKWSPTGHSIAYVHASDLYILPSPSSPAPIRLTDTGNATLFHGLCDWVYEEEVFATPQAVWWSPDATKLAWLTFDETRVPQYTFPVYNTATEPGEERPYTDEVVMRYPKPGYPNPTVSMKVFDLKRYEKEGLAQATFEVELGDGFPPDDRLVTEVAWITSRDLLVTQTNRVSTVQKTAHFDVTDLASAGVQTARGKTAREVDWEKRDGGWFEPAQRMVSLDPSYHVQAGEHLSSTLVPPGYLDVIPDPDGFLHVALFSPPGASEPVFLTKGAWEVDGAIRGVDLRKRLVYFVAARPSTERHLFSVPLPTTSDLASLRSAAAPPPPTPLTDTTSRGAYGCSFSPFARYYLLEYLGPGVPWQRLRKAGNGGFDVAVEENDALKETLRGFAMPSVNWLTLTTADGQEMNALEIKPVNMDETSGRTRYPVLVRIYGGPGSQMVHSRFDPSWHTHLASSRQYVVLMVDGRGTGWKGRAFRSGVRKHLGEYEAMDVIEGVRAYVEERAWVDPKRVGIWGWSYGGYLTAKVLERNSTVFGLGVSVAPVTDWRFYDSVYVERYMDLPTTNAAGYDKSAVVNMTGFQNAAFALAHGSGDDNVHFLNSATLLDRLTAAGVHGFRFRLFPDSDHSITTRNAFPELMRWIEEFLVDRWGQTRVRKAEAHRPGWRRRR